MSSKSQVAGVMSPAERLSLRVSTMISSPKAQIDRRATIHKLDTDPEPVWEALLESLAEIDDLAITHNDDGTVTLEWKAEVMEGVEEEDDEPIVRVERVGA